MNSDTHLIATPAALQIDADVDPHVRDDHQGLAPARLLFSSSAHHPRYEPCQRMKTKRNLSLRQKDRSPATTQALLGTPPCPKTLTTHRFNHPFRTLRTSLGAGFRCGYVLFQNILKHTRVVFFVCDFFQKVPEAKLRYSGDVLICRGILQKYRTTL
jgi:hypothetical protein